MGGVGDIDVPLLLNSSHLGRIEMAVSDGSHAFCARNTPHPIMVSDSGHGMGAAAAGRLMRRA